MGDKQWYAEGRMNGNIYQELTREFNRGRLRAILSSGQAVVMHRLAVMSKDGDWILQEDNAAILHVLRVLHDHGAVYRFGAPLDVRWMSGGWSAHFEFTTDPLRVRTDFVTRPPRISKQALEELWRRTGRESPEIPFVDAVTLAELKKTNRERDYAVIGELARLMEDPWDCLLLSRSARDLIALAQNHPALWEQAISERPLLRHAREGREELEMALDAERRKLMHANEERLQKYMNAANAWAEAWPETLSAIKGLALLDAHRIVVERAERLLPFRV